MLTSALLCLALNAISADPPVMKVEPFAMTDVRLLDGPFRDCMLRDQRYLLNLDVDRLLHTFRLTAGLPTTAQPYGGWEAPKGELRGHTTGHYLSACALMYASTGDARLKDRVDTIVAELAKCQAALPKQGYHPGFLSAYPESFFDRVDARKPVWAPYYTLHKILAGLLDAYEHCGNRQALEVAEKLADWLTFRVGRLTHERMQASLGTEHGGMNESLANLYAITHNPAHLALARAFNHEAIFDPLARGEDQLNGKHANTQIPKITGAAREYELTGETPFRDVAAFFWRQVALKRSFAIGGHSDREHFYPIEQTSRHLGPATAETCNTYNMLKLTRHVFQWDPTAEVMDFYERALYNHILASQDPREGMPIYFAPLKPGHFKTYSTPDDSFWCCTGTGIENHAKYGDTIYFHDADSIFVNLFIASELTWKARGLTLRQETKFPEEDATRLTVHCKEPVDLALKIRWPAWAASIEIAVNGTKTDAAGKPGSYVAVRRAWHDGDRVELRLPMRLHLEPLPDDPHIAAILYGPIVLAGELGTAGLEKTSPYAKKQLDLEHVPSPRTPVFVCDVKDLLSRIEPVAGKPLTFITKGVGRPQDVSLIPYYQLHHQRYNVYWTICSPAEWQQREAEFAAAEAARKAEEARVVDQIQPGEQQPETDHNFRGEQTGSGEFHGRKWRDAKGWFSYDVKCVADKPLVLVCTYWGSDRSHRAFDILVGEKKIATQTLENAKPGKFFDVTYPLPLDLTHGRDKLTIRFTAHPHSTAGGLFGLRVVMK